MTYGTDLNDNLDFRVSEQDAVPKDHLVSRPVAENITEAMDNTPLGSLYDIIYAALAARLKKVLDPESSAGGLLPKTLVQTVQFRAVSPGYSQQASRRPVATDSSGAGAGSYHSKIWGPSPDERLPFTSPDPVSEVPYSMGQDPGLERNKGLLIAKLYADLQQHLPLVLFNVTSKTYVPIGIGGSSYGRRFWQNGKVVTEVIYRATLTVEALAITGDDTSTSHLQAVVEACFGPLRDHVDTGAMITGRTWQLSLPTNLTPSSVTEIEAPWSGGDDKGAKLYTATVGLENLMFECVSYIAHSNALNLSPDHIDAGSQEEPSIKISDSDDTSEPIRLRIGERKRLTITGMPVTADIAVSQTKKVVEVKKPHERGFYEIVPKRVGEAILRVYDGSGTVPVNNPDQSAGRTGAPLCERRVVVTAV